MLPNIGKTQAFAESVQKKLEDLTLSELKVFDPNITNNIYDHLNIKNAVLSKTSYGGTSPTEVLKMINNGAMITLNALSSANLRMFWGVGE